MVVPAGVGARIELQRTAAEVISSAAELGGPGASLEALLGVVMLLVQQELESESASPSTPADPAAAALAPLERNAQRADGGARYKHKIITVEHVLRQSSKLDSQWVADFTPDDREYWVHRLANSVLPDRRKNGAAPNADFAEKSSATLPPTAR